MFTIKVINESDNKTFEEVYQCEHYKRQIDRGEPRSDDGQKIYSNEEFRHYLSLYGCKHFNDGHEIDIASPINGGNYEQNIYIMNDQGKTIDRF